MFDTYLVFDQFHVQNAKPGRESRYWLLGQQLKESTIKLKGWVRQRDVVIWPSRLAVQWNEDATVVGFANPEYLKRGLNPIFPPQKLGVVDFPDRITRRFPVLEQMPPPETIAEKIKPGSSFEDRLAMARENIEYYKIAAPGKACHKSNRNDCLEARDIDRYREKVATAQRAAKRMDVLILIDATESMEPYFISTVTAIQHFVNKAGELGDKVDIRFGISLYGDYRGNNPSIGTVDYHDAVPFFRATPGTVGSASPLVVLGNPAGLIFKDIHRDKLEAPFAAVIRASRDAKWRRVEEAPLRFLIHLADDGNRDKGKTSGETVRARAPDENPSPSTLREVYGEGDVVEALRKHNVIYVPVAVLGGTQQKGTVPIWNRIFQEQATRILQLMGERAPIKKVEVTYSEESIETREARVGKTVAVILESVNTTLRVGRQYEYEAECSGGAKTKRCLELEGKAQPNPAIVWLADEVASKVAGLTPNERHNIYSREQSIIPVYAPAKSKEGKETFTHWVVLEEQEFKILKNMLVSLCKGMGQQDARNPVVKALLDMTSLYADEEFSQLTPAEFLNKKLGIPNLERTDFSSRTRDEIDDAFRAWRGGDRVTWENWHMRMCRAKAFTELMEQNQKVDPSAISCNRNGECSISQGARTRFQWTVRISDAAPVYYVPLDILP
jgi:hypothetical protein